MLFRGYSLILWIDIVQRTALDILETTEQYFNVRVLYHNTLISASLLDPSLFLGTDRVNLMHPEFLLHSAEIT